jgi:hypothetical protein
MKNDSVKTPNQSSVSASNGKTANAPAFTKGPWSVGRTKNRRSSAHVWVKRRDAEIIADVRNFPPFTTNTNQGSETTEANALLIAAAPALYEVLENMRKRHNTKAKMANFTACGCDDCGSADKALSLARGEVNQKKEGNDES